MEPGKLAFRRMIRNASLLGLASLLLNLYSQKINPELPLPLGNLFLFVSANVYGIIGGMISAFISEVPRFILNAESFTFVLKNISLVGFLGFASTALPLIPNALPFIIYWVASVYCVGWISHPMNPATGILLFTYDLMLLALAKMLLMSATLCSWLTTKLRYLTIQLLLPECLFIAFALCSGILITLPLNGTYGYEILSAVGGPYSMLFVAGAACVPLTLGWILTRIILAEYGAELISAIRSSDQKSEFSGILGGAFSRTKQSSHTRSSKAEEEPLPARFEDESEDHCGKMILSQDGSIIFLNSFFRLLSGLTSQEGLGSQVKTASMHPQILEAITSLLAEGTSPGMHAREVRIEDPATNSSRFLDIHLTQSFNRETKENDQFLIRIKDITDRRTVESHLLQAKKVEALGAMVSGVAHSFNDALTAITGQASLAKMTRDMETTERSLDQILDASKQAGLLVQQLLDFALDTSHLLRNEDLVELIKSRSELINRSVGDSFELVLEQHAETLPVKCNSNLILQAITNLILNAMESYESGTGKILVQIDREEIPPELSHFQPSVRPGSFARIRIKDTGSGMPAEVLSKAFDPLFSTKHGIGHTGLGLSIVFAVIRAHDGFLTAESHVGTGTTISLYLPIVSQVSESSNTPITHAFDEAAQSLPTKLTGKKILLVEDDASVLSILELLFSALQCEIISFSNGIDAINKLPEITFDAFLVDLVLPSMSGIEVAKKIRALKGESLPGVIMSGYAIDPKVVEMNLGILRKPFDIVELEAAMAKALSKSR